MVFPDYHLNHFGYSGSNQRGHTEWYLFPAATVPQPLEKLMVHDYSARKSMVGGEGSKQGDALGEIQAQN
jgi:hypothetical protein